MAGVWATSAEPGVQRVQEHLTEGMVMPLESPPLASFQVGWFCLCHPHRAEVQAASAGGGSSGAVLEGD